MYGYFLRSSFVRSSWTIPRNVINTRTASSKSRVAENEMIRREISLNQTLEATALVRSGSSLTGDIPNMACIIIMMPYSVFWLSKLSIPG